MKLPIQEVLLIASLAWVVRAGFWSDIIKALVNSNRYNNLFQGLGTTTTNDLQNDDNEASLFICEVLHGEVPDAVAELGTAIESEVVDDFDALTAFVESIPTLVPQVLSDIVQGGEDAVSIIEELVTNPGAALTVIENGVESVFSDVTAEVVSVFGDVTYFFGCDIGGACASTTSNQILASCDAVLAQSPAAPSTVAAQNTASASPSTVAASSQPSQTAGNANFSEANISRPSYLAAVLVGLGLCFVLLL